MSIVSKIFNIQGMMCEGCVSAVKKVLEEQNGVISAQVVLEANTADVTYDDAVTSPHVLAQKITEAGYDCDL
ncbi:heavy metal-associated domain-containing protein [Porphyromonas pogonae]|uniref:heavy-metal-associated domain-containing protein n=1 Tax=Porphyromonas pogonae TaxID=867595 RepID=UPI002E7A4A54|nr:heavy metal-associated domain-containing protein [Porphyromonas pogonae]